MDRRQFVGAALLVPLERSITSRLSPASSILDSVALAPRGARRARALAASGLIVTEPVLPEPAEPCPDPAGFSRAELDSLTALDNTCYERLRPADYFLPPANLFDGPNQGSDQNEGRVNSIIRLHAQLRDPKKILVNAVSVALGIPINVGPVSVAADPTLAPILAQLAVTGRQSFDLFKAWKPKTADLVAAVREAMPGQTFDNAKLRAAASAALDTAYTTVWAIRANAAGWRARRATMGWIATSGEDDLPHRPINIRTAPYPQYDALVRVKLDDGTQLPIWTRYMVATPTRLEGAEAAPLPAPGSLRSLPNDPATIPRRAKLIIFIPGGGSRADEMAGFADDLIRAGADRGQSYAVIALDLPNSGYSMPFDHTKVAPATASYWPDADQTGPTEPTAAISGYPLLGFEERFIISFIETLHRQFGNVKDRIVAVMGGSLGGNMSLQLARRSADHSFLGTIVAWSATCFAAMNDTRNFFVAEQFAGVGGDMIGRFQEAEQASTRHEWFKRIWVDPLADPEQNAGVAAAVGAVLGVLFGGLIPIPVGPVAGAVAGGAAGQEMGMPPQPTMWYGDSWQPCKLMHIVQSRLDRFEYYTPQHRQWNDRLNYEMAVFSFQEGDVYPSTNTQGPARFLTMTSRLLLAAGQEDDYKNVKNYSNTCEVAEKMVSTPGRTLFLKKIGHSIHAECPKFFARQIVTFLVDG